MNPQHTQYARELGALARKRRQSRLAFSDTYFTRFIQDTGFSRTDIRTLADAWREGYLSVEKGGYPVGSEVYDPIVGETVIEVAGKPGKGRPHD